MYPRAYLDIEVIAGQDSGLSAPVLRGRLMAILHGCFRQIPDRYAIALPEGQQKIRVFASARADFDALVEALQPNRWMRDYARIGYPREVPDDFAGPWVAYRRYRIPTVRSDRNAAGGISALRDRRIRYARQQGLEYFHARSQGTEQSFVLTVERIVLDGPTGECKPNSYGLGSATNTFGVPFLG